MNRVAITCAAVVLLGTLAWRAGSDRDAAAQSGSRRNGTQRERPRRGTSERSFEVRFWKHLQEAEGMAYRTWAPFPGRTAGFYPGRSPHGAFLKIYVNRTAAADPKTLPPGSVIVKENYDEDKRTLLGLTVMYRVKGFDREHGDWYWMKYAPSGRIATAGGKKLMGKVQSCIDCHSGAEGQDFLFVND